MAPKNKLKWYDDPKVDQDIIISSRVRLARNLKKYPFPNKLKASESKEMIKEVKESILSERTPLSKEFKYVDMKDLSGVEKQAMMEQHIISPLMAENKGVCGALIKTDETVSILLNEEDHIRIQTIFPGEDIDEAYTLAEKIDNLIEESVEYAFDEDYGYLTACPTNVGTGLRASYMMHLPALEQSGQIRNVIQAISKFGVTVRGTYGEGTEAMGAVYQVSNQVTLGRSEEEIINNLKKVSNLIIEQEKRMRDKMLAETKDDFIDRVYRSFGILTCAHKISKKEAMGYLSNIREGLLAGVLDIPAPKRSIYSIMMNIQPGILQRHEGKELSSLTRDVIRAKYIREQLSK